MTTAGYAYEGWCPHCKVTHPAERKTCLHCGGPVFPNRLGDPRATGPVAQPGASPFGLPAPAPAPDEDEAQVARGANPLRFGFAAIWVVLGVVTAILRACTENG